jgi:hypothetical protein
MKPVICYKIMDLDEKDKSYKTLFHGINGTKVIPLDKWVKSVRKWAGEGGNKYWTGFHVILSKKKCKKYFKRFTDEKKTRVIVKCLAKSLRPKKSSKGLVFLADELLVLSKQKIEYIKDTNELR